MGKGNVLLIGNSGVGKSTLINAVLGENRAETNWGTAGTTKELKLYENDGVPFRLIDTVGFEPNWIKEMQAINSVQKWSRESAKEGKEDTSINLIWFCVDGTANKLFPKTLENLSRATRMWKSVPVIVVITKSYSEPDRERNIEMVNNAFAKQKRTVNIRNIIPVVASIYTINDNAFAPPFGVDNLIEITNELMPGGIKAHQKDLADFNLSRKRFFAHTIVATTTVTGVAVGAVPVPFPDALILGPIEMMMFNQLAKTYGINKDNQSSNMINRMLEAGTVSIAAKTALSALKAIPGINLAASAVNAIVAGVIIASLGEGAVYIFEKIYLGEKTTEDVDWIDKIIESKFANQFLEKVQVAISKIGPNSDKNTTGQIIADLFK